MNNEKTSDQKASDNNFFISCNSKTTFGKRPCDTFRFYSFNNHKVKEKVIGNSSRKM